MQSKSNRNEIEFSLKPSTEAKVPYKPYLGHSKPMIEASPNPYVDGSLNSYLVANPQITFMKMVYHRFRDFTNVTVPIKVAGVRSRCVYFELSETIRNLGSDYINGISVPTDARYPIKSFTVYFDNNNEVFHIDLLDFLSYLEPNKMSHDNLFIPYRNTISQDKKLYIQIDFKNLHPEDLYLYLNLFKLSESDISDLTTRGNDTLLHSKNYFEHRVTNVDAGEYITVLEPMFSGKINQILILLKPDNGEPLELYASLVAQDREVFVTDPQINMILLANSYGVTEYRPNHYAIPFNDKPFKIGNMTCFTISENDKLNIALKNKNGGAIGSVRIKIWALTYATV